LTLEMGADVELPQGGLQRVKPSAEQQRLETAEARGGGVGEESLEPDPVDAVWATYVEVMGPRKKDLDPGGRPVIKDALKVATVVPSDELSACPDRARPASAAAGRRATARTPMTRPAQPR
jgi:hypothetical protein